VEREEKIARFGPQRLVERQDTALRSITNIEVLSALLWVGSGDLQRDIHGVPSHRVLAVVVGQAAANIPDDCIVTQKRPFSPQGTNLAARCWRSAS
jgi:hypothetical protein